jgi:hypothetical protein
MHSKRAFVTFASFREHAPFAREKPAAPHRRWNRLYWNRLYWYCDETLAKRARAYTSTARLVCNGEGSPHAESKR